MKKLIKPTRKKLITYSCYSSESTAPGNVISSGVTIGEVIAVFLITRDDDD